MPPSEPLTSYKNNQMERTRVNYGPLSSAPQRASCGLRGQIDSQIWVSSIFLRGCITPESYLSDPEDIIVSNYHNGRSGSSRWSGGAEKWSTNYYLTILKSTIVGITLSPFTKTLTPANSLVFVVFLTKDFRLSSLIAVHDFLCEVSQLGREPLNFIIFRGYYGNTPITW